MSHNKTTVGSKTPDTAGEIAVALNDLSDISGSPSTGDALAYGGSGWLPTAPTGDAATTLPYSAYAEYVSFGAGAHYIQTGDWLAWRKYSANPNMIGGPYNTSFWMNATTVHTRDLTNSKWAMGYELPAGRWIVKGVVNWTYASSTEYVDMAWFDAAGNQYGNLVRSQQNKAAGSVNVWGLIEISSLTEVALKCTYASALITNPGGAEHRCIAYQFIKIG